MVKECIIPLGHSFNQVQPFAIKYSLLHAGTRLNQYSTKSNTVKYQINKYRSEYKMSNLLKPVSECHLAAGAIKGKKTGAHLSISHLIQT